MDQRRYLPPLRRFPRRRAYHAYPANCGRPCFPEKEPAHGKPDPGLAPCLLRPSASCGQHSFRLPQPAGFVENRYDQSIFSILCKLRGITTLDGSETYAENWEQLSLFPFQDRRDMGIPRAGKKGWLEKCRQLLLSSKRNGLGIRRQAYKSERKTFWGNPGCQYSMNCGRLFPA